MKSFLELCKERKSIRAYSDRPVKEEDINYILECMRLAPSAVNYQPWRFMIVRGSDCLKLQQCYTNSWFKSVGNCIIACCDHTKTWKRRYDGKDHGDVDLGIVTAYFLLAIVERGLASCCVCNFDAILCKRLFCLGEGIEPVCFLPLGYQDDTIEPRDPGRLPMEDILMQK